ncbi:hypothetical protein ZIOFF_060781 [Zingiber officinale]|uniref:Uncharacterized protein n=1 Tax=Zingiber officinale TaxID=94328 RepID=A0A8J5FC35_ZINOF|nr:hypothetical protein ZIOFF_060781 [Zingiber officinale]
MIAGAPSFLAPPLSHDQAGAEALHHRHRVTIAISEPFLCVLAVVFEVVGCAVLVDLGIWVLWAALWSSSHSFWQWISDHDCDFEVQADCSIWDLEVNQTLNEWVGRIPVFQVVVLNRCNIPDGCLLGNIHMTCDDFNTSLPVDPLKFRLLSFNDCLLVDGGDTYGGDVISFKYAHPGRYPMTISSVTCFPQVQADCSIWNMEVHQEQKGWLRGIPVYQLLVFNLCYIPNGCPLGNVHLTCGDFNTSLPVEPGIVRRLSFNDLRRFLYRLRICSL